MRPVSLRAQRALLVATVALPAALLAASCADVGESDHEVRQLPIINGEPPNAPYHQAVVSLHRVTSSGVQAAPFCSGTLVTDTVVVTAAHCLDTARKGKNFKTMLPSQLAIYVGDEPAVDPSPSIYGVTEALIHSGYDRRNLFNDIALVRLAAPVPTAEATPVPVLPPTIGFTASDVGTAVLNFAGFGDDESGQSGVKLQADGVLGGLGCTVAGCYGADDPATQISYTQYESGPCFGDSGGGAFIDRAGQIYLGGVTSWGDQYCTQFGVSTRADAYASWVATFASPPPPPNCSADGVCNSECAAGEDPDCAPTGGDDCGDGVCGAGESCDGRSGTTSCSADCDGVVKGKPSGRYCYVEGLCEGPGCP